MSMTRPPSPNHPRIEFNHPRFLPVVGRTGTLHLASIHRVVSWDSSGEVADCEGSAFCGASSSSYWTNWSDYGQVEDLCRRCLKAWVRALRDESDGSAREELRGLLAGPPE